MCKTVKSIQLSQIQFFILIAPALCTTDNLSGQKAFRPGLIPHGDRMNPVLVGYMPRLHQENLHLYPHGAALILFSGIK